MKNLQQMTDLEIMQLDATLCGNCNRMCGNDADPGYNTEYECCEDCVGEVEAEIEARREYERDCMSLIVPSSWR